MEALSTGLERIRQLSQEQPEMKLQTLMHNVNAETLAEAHRRQKTGKAAGVDRETKESYENDLQANLAGLMARMKAFSYRPQPVRRTYIPKGDGKLRPLGIPSYEDKLVQGAMADVLEAVYESRFHHCSYGYRPGRSCHDAIRDLVKILSSETHWVVDVDIKGFFDNVNHDWLMKFLEHDIGDKNFLRYIKRFLIAGVMEQGKVYETDRGVPQGGLVSPVLANVYLHYVVDLWFHKVVQKQLRGKARMIRYADDMVFCFGVEDAALEFYEMLKERMAKFGLEISEDKSKIMPWGKRAGADAETFDFLGFTFYGGTTRHGKWTVKLQTSKKKLKAKRQAVKAWLKVNMHQPIGILIQRLNSKLRGHYQYYGVTHNSKKMNDFYMYVCERLQAVLRHRSHRDKTNWEAFRTLLVEYPILKPRIYVSIWG